MRDAHDGWLSIGDVPHAWFPTPSHAAGADLVERLATIGLASASVRSTGVLVAASPDADLAAISAAAKGRGLVDDPRGLRRTQLVLESADLDASCPFWSTVLADLLTVRPVDAVPPLRNRLHLDVSRPAPVVAAAKATIGREPHGAYGLTLADAEGNEVDLVPGDPLGDDPSTSDWWAVFAATVVYPTSSLAEAAALASEVAALADAAGLPLAIDVRPDGVRIDGGKDRWELDGQRALALAAAVQAGARGRGLVADPAAPVFVQALIDAVDLEAVRSWWAGVLGYERDPRPEATDLVDPLGLGPVLLFQPMDADDEGRRAQRDRFHLELDLPASEVAAKVEEAVALGGGATGHVLVDPEGNELVLRGG